jgi:hypothetical protein
MSADHKLICLLSELQSLFPRDSRLGAGGKANFVKGGVIAPNVREITLTQQMKELHHKAKEEMIPRLIWKWKYIHKVTSIPKDPKKKNEFYDRIEALAKSMIAAWKFKKDRLEELKRDAKKVEQDSKDASSLVETKRNTAKKWMQDLERDIDELDKKRHKTPYQNALLKTKRGELPGKKQALDDAEAIWKQTKITMNEDLYTAEYIDCRNALKDLQKSFEAKQNYVISLEKKEEKTDDAKCDLGYIKEKYYTLKKIHDDFLREECNKIINGTAKKRKKT